MLLYYRSVIYILYFWLLFFWPANSNILFGQFTPNLRGRSFLIPGTRSDRLVKGYQSFEEKRGSEVIPKVFKGSELFLYIFLYFPYFHRIRLNSLLFITILLTKPKNAKNMF